MNPQGGDLSTSADELVLKVRKPYTITKQRERWTEEEHNKFLEALKLYGRAWRRIQEHVGTKTAVQIRSHAQKFFTKLGREQGILVGTTKELEIPPPRPKRKPNRPYPRKAGSYSSGSGCEGNGLSAASSGPIATSPTLHESPSKSAGFLPYIAPSNKQPSKSGDSMKLFGHTVVVPTTIKPIPAVISKVDKDSGDCDQNGDWSGAVDFQQLADDPENTEKRNNILPTSDHPFKTLPFQHPFVPEHLGSGQCPGYMLEFMKHMCAGLPVVPNPDNGQCSRSTTPEYSPMIRAGALAYAKYMEGITKLQIPDLKDTPGIAGGAMPWQLTPPANPLSPAFIAAAAAAITWPFSGMPPPAIPPAITGENLPFQAEFTTPLRDANAVAMATIAAASAWWTLQGCFPPNFATRHMGPSCGPQITNFSSMPKGDDSKEPIAQIINDEGKESERASFKLSFVPNSKSPLETSQNQGITVSSTKQLECKALEKITSERLQGNESKGKGRRERRSISGSNTYFSSTATDKGGKASPSFSGSDDSSASDAAVEQLNGDGDVFVGSGSSSNSSRCDTPGSDENVHVSDSFSSDKERESDPYENIVQGNTPMQLQRSIERTPTDSKTCNGQKHCPDNSLERGAKSSQGGPQRLLRPCKNAGLEGEQRKEVSEEGRMAFQALFTREKLPQIFYSCAKRKVNNDNDQLDECNNRRGGAHGASKAPRNVTGDPFSSHTRKSGFNKATDAQSQESDSPEEVVLDKDSSCMRQRPQPKVQTICTMLGTGTNSNAASRTHNKSFDGIGFVPYRKLMNECKLNCRSEEASSIEDSIRDRKRCLVEEDVQN